MKKIEYLSALQASEILKNNAVFCKIKNKEHKVGYVNLNNKTFSAERQHSSRPYNFEDFEDIDNVFYKK